MVIATSLVVNHVNPGALCLYVVFVFMIMLSTVIRRIYITDKEVNYNMWLYMNAKIYKDILSV